MHLNLMPQSVCHGNLLTVESSTKSRSFGDTFSSCSQDVSSSAMDFSLMPQSACHGNLFSVERRPKSKSFGDTFTSCSQEGLSQFNGFESDASECLSRQLARCCKSAQKLFQSRAFLSLNLETLFRHVARGVQPAHWL